MNSECRRTRSSARQNFQVIEGKRTSEEVILPKIGSEEEKAIVASIEIHGLSLRRVGITLGIPWSVVFEVYRRELAKRVEKAYIKGFREGRFNPVRPMRPAA